MSKKDVTGIQFTNSSSQIFSCLHDESKHTGLFSAGCGFKPRTSHVARQSKSNPALSTSTTARVSKERGVFSITLGLVEL